MKILSVLFLAVGLFMIGCGQSNKDSQNNELNSPGPVTESDKNRYNLNSNDELVYGSVDSVMQDSLHADTVEVPKR